MDSVSIIIPCLNEEAFIGKCLDSILDSTYSKDKIEIIIIDGMSTDKTRQIISKYQEKYAFINLLDNPQKNTPSALNIGIKASTAKTIIRLDAHTTYSKDYFEKCVKYIDEYEADNVGGVIVPSPRVDSLVAKAISVSLSSPFGVGLSRFRLGVTKPTEVDTVPFGCFRRSLFEKIGFFNEDVPRNEDIDLNHRIKKNGGKIMLFPDIVSYYYPRSTLSQFWTHNSHNGWTIIRAAAQQNFRFSLRHILPLFFVLSLIVLIGAAFVYQSAIWALAGVIMVYLSMNIFESIRVGIQKKDLRLIILLPFIYSLLHISYGLGSLKGIVDYIFSAVTGPE